MGMVNGRWAFDRGYFEEKSIQGQHPTDLARHYGGIILPYLTRCLETTSPVMVHYDERVKELREAIAMISQQPASNDPSEQSLRLAMQTAPSTRRNIEPWREWLLTLPQDVRAYLIAQWRG